MPTIILTGGGSGGHITPLLSLAHALKEKDPKCRVIYVGLKSEKLEGLQERYKVFDQVCALPSGKFRRYHGQSALAYLVDLKTLFLNARDLTRVGRGIFSARKLLKQLRPDVVFSKGGYGAVPVGIAAHQLGIPIITHDSDAVPGLANRILGRWAAVHAVGQPIENYSYSKDSTSYTGIPVDERIKPVTTAMQKDFKMQFGLPADSLALLVTGGGLGSGSLNGLIAQIAPGLLAALPNLHIAVVAGTQHQAEVQAAFDQIPEAKGRVRVIGFTPEFYTLSGAADLILCRAGASTLAEFAIQRKALVIIPAAQLAGGHQLANVRPLVAAKAARVLPADAGPDQVLKTLGELLQDQTKRAELGAKLDAFAKPKAAQDLAELTLETAKPKAAA